MTQGHMEVKKHAVRQTQDGWVVSFVIHPNDMSPELATAPLGTRFMIGYAAIGDDEQPVQQTAAVVKLPLPSPKSEAAKDRYRSMPEWEKAATRAVMLCKDEKFWGWIRVHHSGGWFGALAEVKSGDYEAVAALWLGTQLNIKSRRDIATDKRAYDNFIALEIAYRTYTGQMAEPR